MKRVERLGEGIEKDMSCEVWINKANQKNKTLEGACPPGCLLCLPNSGGYNLTRHRVTYRIAVFRPGTW
jgi:hypothetical protein